MSRIARLRQLTWPERRLFFGALVLLPMTALGLRLFGVRRVRVALAKLVPLSARDRTVGKALAQASEVARLVSAAARHGPYRAKCLPTALALQTILRRRGIGADLRFGVRKAADRIEAHAWVEHQGMPLIDSSDIRERYSAFDDAIENRAAISR